MNRTTVLAIIVFSQFAGVSLWFLPNAFIHQVAAENGTGSASVSLVTSMVQFGFITGTFVYALLSLADRISPSKLFFYSTALAAMCNLALLTSAFDSIGFYVFRFLIGFFLAGIYPVGMKIAADYFDVSISKALGLLVGALVLGTALPHLLVGASISMSWQTVIWITSALAITGGLCVLLFIPDGPFRKRGMRFEPRVIVDVFKNKPFRKATFGYFGHMWELYAFWAFVPLWIFSKAGAWFNENQQQASLFAFAVIGIGSLSCIAGGYLSTNRYERINSYTVALVALVVSGLCCLISPFIFQLSMIIQLCFLLIWGMAVIMDSPQFSSMVAQCAPAEQRGSAITIVTCIGFGITIISIALLGYLLPRVGVEWVFLFLLPGPVFGVLAMWRGRTSVELNS